MSTVFAYAKATSTVIDLLNRQCGISRSNLHSESQLESDLGIIGDDTYELLEALRREHGVDMSHFDCGDWISPEGLPLHHGVFFAVVCGLTAIGVSYVFPSCPEWLLLPFSIVGAFLILIGIRKITKKPRDEIRIRDLVLSVEAKRWVSPKAEQ